MSTFFGGLSRRVGVLIYADDRQLQETLDRSSKSLRKFSAEAGKSSKLNQSLRGALSVSGGKGGFLFGSGAFVGSAITTAAIAKSIQVASNLNEQISKSRVVFQDSSAEIERWSKTAASSMGVARDQAIEAAGSFGAMFRSAGQAGDKAAEMSERIVQLAGDLASFNNTSVDDALTALRSGLSGEIEPMRRYQVFLTEAAVQQKAMAMTGKDNAKQLTQGEKILARYTLILQQTTRQQGDYKRTSTGLANETRTLQANLRDLSAEMGETFVPILASVTGWLNKGIQAMSGMGESAKLTADVLKDPKFIQAVQALNGTFKGIGILNQLQATQIVAPGEGFVRPTEGGPGAPSKTPPPSLVTSLPGRLVDNLLNARLSGNDQAVKAALQDEADFIKRMLGQKKLNRKQREGLKNDLLSVVAEIDGINQTASNAAKAAADAAKQAAEESKRKQKEAAEKAKAAAKKAAEAAKKAAQALLDQGNALKDAALARLDAVKDKRDVMRDLVDAKEALKLAKRIGGSHGILMAQRGLQDAELARKRSLLEQATVTPAGKTAKAGFNINGGSFHFHGVQNVKQLQAELAKLSNRSTSQSRGHSPGIPHGL